MHTCFTSQLLHGLGIGLVLETAGLDYNTDSIGSRDRSRDLFLFVDLEVLLQLGQLVLYLGEHRALRLERLHGGAERVLGLLERDLLGRHDLSDDVVLLDRQQPPTQALARRRRHLYLFRVEVRIRDVLRTDHLTCAQSVRKSNNVYGKYSFSGNN